MGNLTSISDKQLLAQDSKYSLKWEDLDSQDRKIVMSVCFSGSAEKARKDLKLSIGGFYKRWKYLKPVYNTLLNDFPAQAINILKVASQRAAETLVDTLGSDNSSDRIKAANSILNRVIPEGKQMPHGIQRKLTIEEFVDQDGISPLPRTH